MKFSVLLSIYNQESIVFFERAMRSIWDEQLIKPNEIVLVKDGLLRNELDECIQAWKEKIGNLFKVISLSENVGLGIAINAGLNECTYDLVARMDIAYIS
jgi:glycosyltransferase involved in cell wall biosynthesis